MKTLKVKVKFYIEKRNSFPNLNYGYRPHLVISGDTKMLGVEFTGLDLTEFNKFGEAKVKFLYDNVDYSKLSKGVTFNIMEGSLVVGDGKVSD